MEHIGAYILRVCCCAIMVSLLRSVGGEGPGKKLRELIGGAFLALALLFPLRDLEISPLTLPDALYDEGQTIAADARAEVNSEISDIIIQRTHAYILDEAESLGAELEVVSLALDEETLAPCRVELQGQAGPYARSILARMLSEDLGIAKEDQIWLPNE